MSTQWIHRTKLLANPLQPPARGIVPPDVAEYLGKSILNHGFEQLPLVRPHGINFQVADGHQRVFGAIPWILATEEYEVQEGDKKSVVKITAEDKARFETIECVVREMTDQEMLDCIIESNMKRRDMTPMDEAWAFSTYIEKFGVTQAAFAQKHGMSQGQVGNTIRLLTLPEPIQQKLISCEINEGQARQLLRLNAEPKLQTKFLEAAAKEQLTVNALDSRINQEIYYNSLALDNSYRFGESAKFDTSACADCPHRVMANEPYGNNKKAPRCLDKECWKAKQTDAIKEAVRLAQEQAQAAGGKKAKGVKILSHNDLAYDKYSELQEYTLKDLDDPGECKTCPRKALFKYDLTEKGEPKLVCVDMACFRRKKTKHTRDEHKSQKEKDLALTMQIGKALEHVAKNPHNCLVVLAHYVLGKATGEQTGLDLLKMFETLPKTMNGRLDLTPLLKSLEDRSMDELLQLTVAGAITLERRGVYGYSQMGYGTKLSGALKRQIAFLTGTMSQYRKSIVAWRKDNCEGCRHNFQPDSIRKPDEKNCNMGTDYDIDARCPSRYIEKKKEEPSHVPPKEPDESDAAYNERVYRGTPSPETPIPEGVRRDIDVAKDECQKCDLATQDHTIGGKFRDAHNAGAMLKVCIKDHRRWEQAQALKKEVATADANSQRILEEAGLKPAKPKYTVKKVGNSHIALDDDNRVIAIEVTKAAAADQAEASLLPVATIKSPKPAQFVLNHTYRIVRKVTYPDVPDITAQDLPTAIAAHLIIPESIEQVKVWKSSGKVGTGGSVSSGWSKCAEPIEKPKKDLAAIGFNSGDDESP